MSICVPAKEEDELKEPSNTQAKYPCTGYQPNPPRRRIHLGEIVLVVCACWLVSAVFMKDPISVGIPVLGEAS